MCCDLVEQRATTRYMSDRAPAAAFHAAIKAALDQMGRTQVWLSKETGIPRSTLNAWKTQPRPPYAKTVIRVADALGMDRNEALRLAGRESDVRVALEDQVVSLDEVRTDDLLAEIRRRIVEANSDADAD